MLLRGEQQSQSIVYRMYVCERDSCISLQSAGNLAHQHVEKLLISWKKDYPNSYIHTYTYICYILYSPIYTYTICMYIHIHTLFIYKYIHRLYKSHSKHIHKYMFTMNYKHFIVGIYTYILRYIHTYMVHPLRLSPPWKLELLIRAV